MVHRVQGIFDDEENREREERESAGARNNPIFPQFQLERQKEISLNM